MLHLLLLALEFRSDISNGRGSEDTVSIAIAIIGHAEMRGSGRGRAGDVLVGDLANELVGDWAVELVDDWTVELSHDFVEGVVKGREDFDGGGDDAIWCWGDDVSW